MGYVIVPSRVPTIPGTNMTTVFCLAIASWKKGKFSSNVFEGVACKVQGVSLELLMYLLLYIYIYVFCMIHTFYMCNGMYILKSTLLCI